nr:hypothetical protein [Tanacetum cinerariifolium]
MASSLMNSITCSSYLHPPSPLSCGEKWFEVQEQRDLLLPIHKERPRIGLGYHDVPISSNMGFRVPRQKLLGSRRKPNWLRKPDWSGFRGFDEEDGLGPAHRGATPDRPKGRFGTTTHHHAAPPQHNAGWSVMTLRCLVRKVKARQLDVFG